MITFPTSHPCVPLSICIKRKELLPSYADPLSSGFDLKADLRDSNDGFDITLRPGETKLIPTGIRSIIPRGYEIQIRSRSGLALNHGVVVSNSPGTLDSSFRGLWGIILYNHGSENFIVHDGMKVAQAVLVPVVHADISIITEEQLAQNVTTRGEGGFGSTGLLYFI